MPLSSRKITMLRRAEEEKRRSSSTSESGEESLRAVVNVSGNPFLSNIEEGYREKAGSGLAYFNYYAGKIYGSSYLSAFRRSMGLALLNLANLVNNMFGVDYNSLLKKRSLMEKLEELYNTAHGAMYRLVRYNPFLYTVERRGNTLYVDFSRPASSPYAEHAWNLFESTLSFVRRLGCRGGGFFYRLFPYLAFNMYSIVPRYAYSTAMSYIWENEPKYSSNIVYSMGMGAYAASLAYSDYYRRIGKKLGSLWKEVQTSL